MEKHRLGDAGSSDPHARSRTVETARPQLPTSVEDGWTGEGIHLRRHRADLRVSRGAIQSGTPSRLIANRAHFGEPLKEVDSAVRLDWRHAFTGRSFGASREVEVVGQSVL